MVGKMFHFKLRKLAKIAKLEISLLSLSILFSNYMLNYILYVPLNGNASKKKKKWGEINNTK